MELERMKENIREEIDCIKTHEAVIVPKEQWEEAQEKAKSLFFEGEEICEKRSTCWRYS